MPTTPAFSPERWALDRRKTGQNDSVGDCLVVLDRWYDGRAQNPPDGQGFCEEAGVKVSARGAEVWRFGRLLPGRRDLAAHFGVFRCGLATV